jgi:uncharacterized membrane protein YwzB
MKCLITTLKSLQKEIKNMKDRHAWLIVLCVVIVTLSSSYLISDFMMNRNTNEISTVNMTDEEIRLLEMWME